MEKILRYQKILKMASETVLYTCVDSPPGRTVQMALKYLNIPHIIKDVNFDEGEHFSEKFLKMYPQGEIPVLNDKGVIIGESIAIIQYLAERYGKNETFYPKHDAVIRSVIHHRLAFYLSTYYRRVHDYMILPMDYAGYERNDEKLAKTNHALRVFNEFLRREGTNYVVGANVTIADLPFIMGTVALKAMDFDFTPFPCVTNWFESFQRNHSDLWEVAEEGLKGLTVSTNIRTSSSGPDIVLESGVSLSHAALINSILDYPSIGIDDTIFCFSTIYWLGAWFFLLTATFRGATRLITRKSFSPDLELDLIEKYKINVVLNTPHQLSMLLKFDRIYKSDLSTIKMMIVSGTKLLIDIKSKMKNLLRNGTICNAYGMSEVVGYIACDFCENPSLDTNGQILNRCFIKITDKNGHRCNVNVDGEICIKTRYKFLGYYGCPEATEELFDAEDYVHRGDIGHFDEKGNLYVVDRKKDLLKYCTFPIAPSEIEDFLIQSPAIAAVCVIGIPDDVATDLPAAVIVRNKGFLITEKEVFNLVSDNFIDSRKLRGCVYFVDSLPTTPSGKIVSADDYVEPERCTGPPPFDFRMSPDNCCKKPIFKADIRECLNKTRQVIVKRFQNVRNKKNEEQSETAVNADEGCLANCFSTNDIFQNDEINRDELVKVLEAHTEDSAWQSIHSVAVDRCIEVLKPDLKNIQNSRKGAHRCNRVAVLMLVCLNGQYFAKCPETHFQTDNDNCKKFQEHVETCPMPRGGPFGRGFGRKGFGGKKGGSFRPNYGPEFDHGSGLFFGGGPDFGPGFTFGHGPNFATGLHSYLILYVWYDLVIPRLELSISFRAPRTTIQSANSNPNPPNPPGMMNTKLGSKCTLGTTFMGTVNDEKGSSRIFKTTFPTCFPVPKYRNAFSMS
ncbi:4-coumarate-CoA ligase 1 [Pseudolycoriella hygida]|uniref:4-coumarate-CoA ligase 1 n=1 Tax=Pseudolycoriella hygida TaxID=35572 RepID=A0A9Q0MJP2_9DIPT|nr:4-coumarate-CoA ligase 1 [Pseudolycoriella hygida]